MKYNIIAAIADNFAIGLNNEIPWHISEDLRLFKKLTLGNIVIMGRKTFESIGKPLPGRTTIVVSSSEKVCEVLGEAGIRVLSSFEAAIEAAAAIANETSDGNSQIFVAGGASIYAQAIDGADKLYISNVPGSFDGDTFFPKFSEENWKLETEKKFSDFTQKIYSRKA